MARDWFAFFKPSSEPLTRLFCIPHAGGGAAVFAHWPRRFPPFVEVVGVRLPGRERRLAEPPQTSFSRVLEGLTGAMLSHIEVPFALFGSCSGALLVFEIARALRRKGAPAPLALYVGGQRSPDTPSRSGDFSHLPDGEFVDRVLALGGTPPEVLHNADLRALILPTLRADFELFAHYTYSDEPPLQVPIRAIAGMQDTTVPEEEMRRWSLQTTTSFRYFVLPGDHFSLVQDGRLLSTLISSDMMDLQATAHRRT